MYTIECPSGLRGTLRGMKVKDEQIFANRKLVKSGLALSTLLNNCWEDTTDPGPYVGMSHIDWHNLSSPDRTYALIHLRAFTYGDEYEFRLTCDRCKHHHGWGVDLVKDLDVIDMHDAARASIREDQPYVIESKEFGQIYCRVPTGVDEAYLATLDGKEDVKASIYQLARQIVKIADAEDFDSIMTLVEDIPARVADDIRDQIDDIEGGVDTSFDVECPKCESTQQVFLPFEASFFSSRRRFKRSSKSRTRRREIG